MTVILKTNLIEEESSHAELMKCTSESPREAVVPTTLLTTKTKTRIGTWNIRTLYETGKRHKYVEKCTDTNSIYWASVRRNGQGQEEQV